MPLYLFYHLFLHVISILLWFILSYILFITFFIISCIYFCLHFIFGTQNNCFINLPIHLILSFLPLLPSTHSFSHILTLSSYSFPFIHPFIHRLILLFNYQIIIFPLNLFNHSFITSFLNSPTVHALAFPHSTLLVPQKTIPLRHKEIHIVNLPSALMAVFEFAKTLLSDKIKNRFQVSVCLACFGETLGCGKVR